MMKRVSVSIPALTSVPDCFNLNHMHHGALFWLICVGLSDHSSIISACGGTGGKRWGFPLAACYHIFIYEVVYLLPFLLTDINEFRSCCWVVFFFYFGRWMCLCLRGARRILYLSLRCRREMVFHISIRALVEVKWEKSHFFTCTAA